VDSARDLETAITAAIIQQLSSPTPDLSPATHLAAWAAGDFYTRPIEIFTVNYDLLIEQGLEGIGAPYFDGFVGALAASFRTDMVDPSGHAGADLLPASFVRLWKLHGSLNWESTKDGGVIRRGVPVAHGDMAAIYPSDEKYDQSRRVPFVVLHDRFRHALAEPETLTLVCGYSFGDDHLNEIIFDAARRHPRSEIVVLCRTAMSDKITANLLPNLTVLAATEAIIGGTRADWKSLDATDNTGEAWDDDKFRLGDFAVFARFLATVPRGGSIGSSVPALASGTTAEPSTDTNGDLRGA